MVNKKSNNFDIQPSPHPPSQGKEASYWNFSFNPTDSSLMVTENNVPIFFIRMVNKNNENLEIASNIPLITLQ